MIAVTPRQMNEIDNFAINNIGIPGIVLMENAAICVLKEINKDFGCVKGKKICLFAGKGNNGGDAFAIARHLFNTGAIVNVFILTPRENIKGDAATNLEVLDKMGVNAKEILDDVGVQSLKDFLDGIDLIVDGIFGTGLKGGISDIIANVITLINQKGVPVLAIDIPSGLNGETGKSSETCIHAYKTVTFGYAKLGLFVHPGCEYTGEVVVADIGIPKSVIDKFHINNYIIDRDIANDLIPKRVANTNKGSYGKILVIAGSKGMTGAASLTGKAALRSGAGLVYMAAPASTLLVFESNFIECVTLPLEDEDLGYLSKKCMPELLKHLLIANVIVIGPGLSVKGSVGEVVYSIVENSKVPMVIDADALNVLSLNISVLKKASVPMIVTPHPGEMARLLKISIDDVQSNRIEVAREFSAKWNVVTVLKGSKTVVAVPDGRIYINVTGNSGMATGGTGDVLAGIIAGFIGQGLEPYKAAISGVYVHGLCGDNAAYIKGEHGVIAGDLIEELPSAIKGVLK